MPTPAESRRLDHLEIARRYRAKRKRWPRPTVAMIRVRELDALFASRYGDTLPDDDAGRDDLAIMAHHLAGLPGSIDANVTQWVQRRAPWLPVGDLAGLLLEVTTNPTRWKADRLAWRLRLTDRERSALGITTIGAVNLSKAARTARRRALKNAAREAARRAQGAIARADYEAASIARRRPWEAIGISRRTWYRRRSATT
jgi:hypothetical protein